MSYYDAANLVTVSKTNLINKRWNSKNHCWENTATSLLQSCPEVSAALELTSRPAQSSQLLLATFPNRWFDSGSGPFQYWTVAMGLTTRKPQLLEMGRFYPQKPSISSSQLWLQLSIWVLIVSWEDQYIDSAVWAALRPRGFRFAIRPIIVESL